MSSNSNRMCAPGESIRMVFWSWLSQDPLGLAGWPNMFVYAAANPNLRADPSGLLDCKPVSLDDVVKNQPWTIATIYCVDGEWTPIILQRNHRDGRPWDACVLRCMIEHEKVHIEQHKFLGCSDFCEKKGCDGMAATFDRLTLKKWECAGYARERTCLLGYLTRPGSGILGCNRGEIFERLSNLPELERRNGHQCKVFKDPLPDPRDPNPGAPPWEPPYSDLVDFYTPDGPNYLPLPPSPFDDVFLPPKVLLPKPPKQK